MLLQHSTWREVEAYLARSSVIVIPIGSTEQHGPIGLIGTDAICAETIAQALGARRAVLIGPTLALGVAQFNLAFPGTVSLRATTLMANIDDYVSSLARQGLTRFYFVNGHGGNIAPAQAAFQDLYASYSFTQSPCPIRCRLRSWWEYPNVNALRSSLYGEAEGLHATPSEVALTQYALPASVHGAPETLDSSETLDPTPPRLSPEFKRDHAGDNHFDATTHRVMFPDGRVGSDSALARPEHGRALLEAAIADAWVDLQAFLAEP